MLQEINEDSARIPLESLSEALLQSLTKSRGLDAATELLFQSVCNSSHHGPAIQTIDRLCQQKAPSTSAPQVAIVPGFLHRDFPDSGADGKLLIEAANHLGWHHEVIPVESTGRLLDNARIILQWLERARQGPWVLASISKGGSDIVAAMQLDERREAFRNVVGWVDVCGILRGSAVVDRVSRQRLRMLGFRALFALRRWCFASVLDLRRDGGVLEAGFNVPGHMNVVHAIGFPNDADFVREKLRSFHQQMGSLGPNDGAILLYDSIRAPGVVYPVRGADHYMRPRFRVQPLCQGLLRYAAGHDPSEETN